MVAQAVGQPETGEREASRTTPPNPPTRPPSIFRVPLPFTAVWGGVTLLCYRSLGGVSGERQATRATHPNRPTNFVPSFIAVSITHLVRVQMLVFSNHLGKSWVLFISESNCFHQMEFSDTYSSHFSVKETARHGNKVHVVVCPFYFLPFHPLSNSPHLISRPKIAITTSSPTRILKQLGDITI